MKMQKYKDIIIYSRYLSIGADFKHRTKYVAIHK